MMSHPKMAARSGRGERVGWGWWGGGGEGYSCTQEHADPSTIPLWRLQFTYLDAGQRYLSEIEQTGAYMNATPAGDSSAILLY